jgi:16S rRNA (guanine527-N7)-methyltransferase
MLHCRAFRLRAASINIVEHHIMTENDVVAAAQAVDVQLTEQQAGLFVRFAQLLVEWNQRFNLTALDDDASILALHFADSLTPAPLLREILRLTPAPMLIDVGAGGGFPGIPLKIALPELRVTLMDSTSKKIQFCDEVIGALGLRSIRALHGRAEEVAHQTDHRERYDIVTARAVAPLPTLAEYLLPFARPGGVCIAMKGSDAQAEVDRAIGAIDKLGGEVSRVETVNLPGRADRRALIVIAKRRPTPKLYPRQGGAPRKSPLS